MTQFYIGCKQVEGWESPQDGKPGYAVKYPDGYQSWSPKEAFESAYLPMGAKTENTGPGEYTLVNSDTVTQQMVEDFITCREVHTVGKKTTVVHATLKNGFEIIESSSCVDPANYSEELGAKICMKRIKNQVWHLLGFALQWARAGLNA